MLNVEHQEPERDELEFVLDAATALDMTDESNVLYVQGAAGDQLTLLGSWRKDAASHRGEDGRTYHLYTAKSGGEDVAVYVDQDITLI